MARAVAASSTALQARRRASARARLWTRLFALAAVVVLVGIALGFVFAGSPEKLASGTRIAGIDVGGLTPADAEQLLEKRSARLERVPVTFVAGDGRDG
jgi:4-amino-4-deoxy-L-arabinose transferase-like glycosyltransferase